MNQHRQDTTTERKVVTISICIIVLFLLVDPSKTQVEKGVNTMLEFLNL
jgi:hypothetical protein